MASDAGGVKACDADDHVSSADPALSRHGLVAVVISARIAS